MDSLVKSSKPYNMTETELALSLSIENVRNNTLLQESVVLKNEDLINYLIEKRVSEIKKINTVGLITEPIAHNAGAFKTMSDYSSFYVHFLHPYIDITSNNAMHMMDAHSLVQILASAKKVVKISNNLLQDILHNEIRSAEELLQVLEIDESHSKFFPTNGEQQQILDKALYFKLFSTGEQNRNYLIYLMQIIHSCIKNIELYVKGYLCFDMMKRGFNARSLSLEDIFDDRMIDMKNSDGATLLHMAALFAQPTLFVWLLEVGNFPIIQLSENKQTVLHFVAIKQKVFTSRIIKQIRLKCTDIEWNAISIQKDVKGWTPMHIAAKKANLDAVIQLCALGMQYDILSENSKTPGKVAKGKAAELLKDVDTLFKDAPKLSLYQLNSRIFAKDEFSEAKQNARNNNGNTVTMLLRSTNW